MPKYLKRKYTKRVGLPPGTLISEEEEIVEKVKIKVVNYDETNAEERETDNIEESLNFVNKTNMTWIQITGTQDVSVIEKIGNFFKLHPLLLEDIMEADQRPRSEEYGEYIFVVLKHVYYPKDEDFLNEVQVYLIVGKNFVISFQDREIELFYPIEDRIRKGKGRVRKGGSDYLAYILIDILVDYYFLTIDRIANEIDKIEEQLLQEPSHGITNKIHKLKRDVLYIHKSVWPLRELVNSLERIESIFNRDNIFIYFRDLQSHITQILDTIDTFREMLNGLFEIYLTSVSNSLNQIMKILTIISTIFIPLGFIASLYGMNFHYMPELTLPFGYYLALLMMALIGIGMLLFFKKKNWF